MSGGVCRIETAASCNGIADSFKGAGTTCEEFCPITTTTTSTTLFTTTTTTTTTTTSTTQPLGACCEPAGNCLDLIEVSCALGTWQGNGTECSTTECPQPTTTTVLDTTTTTEEPILCGDANGDGDITAADALIALRTAVGTGNCHVTICDYNGNEEVQTSDALAILRVAVGQIVVPMCPIV